MPEYDPLADLYDLEYAHDYDLGFWLALAGREGAPVVEWGAGTGRIAVPLAGAGLDITAVEASEAMIEQGRAKNGTVEWIHGDMRSAKLGRWYRLAVCAFNSFSCLWSVDDTLAFLRNAREHLEPGGLLGIEVSAFSPEELSDSPGGPSLRHDFTRELPGGRWSASASPGTIQPHSSSRCASSTNCTIRRGRWRTSGCTNSPFASLGVVS